MTEPPAKPPLAELRPETLHSPFGDVNIMDAPPGREGRPGDNSAIAVDIDDEQLAADVFTKLGADGTVLMPFEPTLCAGW